MKEYKTVDAYIKSFPAPVQKKLLELRKIITKAVPKAEEGISYGMPGYKYHGVLIYFGGFASHIGIYPTPEGIVRFKKELQKYKTSKGTMQIPLDEALPVTLITKLVTFKAKENLQKSKEKKKAKQAK